MLLRRRELVTGAAALGLMGFAHGQAPPNYPTPTGILTPISQASPLGAMSLPAMAPMTPDANTITVDSSTTYQSMNGVGAALSGSAVYCLQNYLTSSALTAFLTEWFTTNGSSLIRIPFGSTDFENLGAGPSYAYWTYDDVANDTTLANFSLGSHLTTLIPVVQQILAINPAVQILASVWSPPAWIKSSASLTSGSVTQNSTNLTFYANYLVKAIQAFAAQGITINWLTFANEPDNGNTGYPVCTWAASDYTNFIATYLGPALAAAGLSTKISVADTSSFAESISTTVLANSTAKGYTAGLSWHAYASAPSVVASETAANPTLAAWMTEFRSLMSASIASTHTTMAQLMQGCLTAGFGGFIFWNAALDQSGNPSTVNTNRRGVVTINNSTGVISRNPEYNVLAHIGRYTPAGTKRSNCNTFANGPGGTDVGAASFLQPSGERAVFLYNGNASARSIKVYDQQRAIGFPLTMQPGDMMTVAWPGH
jgi:glucosylceramidase